MGETALTFYFCGVSQRWQLDWCRLYEYERATDHRARVRRVWHAKVKVQCRVVLGDAERAFKSQSECETYALKTYGRVALPYEAFIETGVTRWVKVS